MILQILTDTGISANWVMAGAVSLACFLLWRILSRMEAKLDAHEIQINATKQDVAVLKAGQPKPDDLATAVVKALQNSKFAP